FVEDARRDSLKMRGMEGAPTLAVEALSPSTARIDRTRKRALYARYGVPNLWFVDIDEQVIEAQVLRAGAYVIAVAASGSEPATPPPFAALGLPPPPLGPWAASAVHLRSPPAARLTPRPARAPRSPRPGRAPRAGAHPGRTRPSRECAR